MVSPKLMEYLKKKKESGYPNELLRVQFVKSGWPSEIVDQALGELNQVKKEIPVENFVPAELITNVIPPPVQPQNNTTFMSTRNPEDAVVMPNKWRYSLYVLLFMLSSYFGEIGTAALGMLYIFYTKITGKDMILSQAVNLMPLYLAALLALIVSLYYFYLIFRSSAYSKKSWKQILVSLVAIPIIYYPLANIILKPFIELNASIGPTEEPLRIYPGLDLLYTLILMGILYLSRIYNRQVDTGLSKKVKIWLTIVAVLTGITYSLFLTFLTNDPGDNDNGYSDSVSAIGYKVYKVNSIPEGTAIASLYSVDTDKNGQKLVRVALDNSEPLSESRVSKAIVINQYQVPPDYDDNSLKIEDGATVSEVPLALSRTQYAYLRTKPFGDGQLHFLTFVSIDNIRVEIGSPRAEAKDLIEIAVGLSY